MVNVRHHYKRLITNDFLKSLPDWRFEGTIAQAVEEKVFHKWTLKYRERIVVYFTDGVYWIPNDPCVQRLIEWLSDETDRWAEYRVAVFLAEVERRNKETGRTTRRWERHCALIALAPREATT